MTTTKTPPGASSAPLGSREATPITSDEDWSDLQVALQELSCAVGHTTDPGACRRVTAHVRQVTGLVPVESDEWLPRQRVSAGQTHPIPTMTSR